MWLLDPSPLQSQRQDTGVTSACHKVGTDSRPMEGSQLTDLGEIDKRAALTSQSQLVKLTRPVWAECAEYFGVGIPLSWLDAALNIIEFTLASPQSTHTPSKWFQIASF